MDMPYDDIKEFEGLIPIIPEDKNYWLIRTQSGQYFQEFYLGNYVAIGWNEINDYDLIKDTGKYDELVDLIKEIYKDKEKMPGLIAGNIKKFVNEMKKGDIIIIPSENSRFIAFGELLEDEIYEEEINLEDIEDGACDFKKRRRVKWLKHQNKKEIDIYIHRLLNSHHAITNANDYSTFIDRTLYPFYIKDDEAHFTLRVNETKKIKAIELANLINNNLAVIDNFNKILDEKLNKNNVDMKINVQSPGPVEIYGAIKEIAVIGFFIMLVCGGSFKLTHKNKQKDTEFNTELKTDGFMEKLIKFLDHKNENKIELMKLEESIKKSQEQLKINVPTQEQLLITGSDVECESAMDQTVQMENRKE